MISIRLSKVKKLGIFLIWLLSLVLLVGLPSWSCLFLGRGNLAAEDTRMQMTCIRPCEEHEEIGWDRDEAKRARTLTLVGSSPVLIGLLLQLVEVSLGRSVCTELIAKQVESRDPSRGTFLVKGHLLRNMLYLFRC